MLKFNCLKILPENFPFNFNHSFVTVTLQIKTQTGLVYWYIWHLTLSIMDTWNIINFFLIWQLFVTEQSIRNRAHTQKVNITLSWTYKTLGTIWSKQCFAIFTSRTKLVLLRMIYYLEYIFENVIDNRKVRNNICIVTLM